MFTKTFLLITCLVIICLVFVIVLTSCRGRREARQFNSIANSLTAREMLDRNLQYRRDGNARLLRLTMHSSRRNATLDLNNLVRFDVLSIEEEWTDELAQDWQSTNNFYATTSFVVKYDIEFREERRQLNGIYTDRFVFIKEYEDSPWLLFAQGRAFI